MLVQLLFLFAAGFFGGVINSLAGGGSFITFPALIWVGVPPVSANATNTFASCAGYLSGAYGFRQELAKYRSEMPQFILVSLIGGILGAGLLLQTPESVFRQAIPWLLLFATVLFVWGAGLNRALRRYGSGNRHATRLAGLLLGLTLLGVCTYGGFFNAGLGIIILSYLVLAGYSDINAMNGIKLLISSMVSLIAIVLFMASNLIAWREAMAVLLGTLVGGYVAAHVSRQLSQQVVRTVVILASGVITLYFFIDVYALEP